jgi:hypothetical protein
MPELDDIDRDQLLAGLYLLMRFREGVIVLAEGHAQAAEGLASYRQRLDVGDLEQLFDDLNRMQLPIRTMERVLCTLED